MKTKTLLSSFSAVLGTGIFVIFSCTRDESPLTNETDQFKLAEKETVFEAVLQKADDQINKEITLLENFNYNILANKSGEAESCKAKITVETPTNSKFPKTITLDFGTGCTDTEGNFRAGKIVVHITGPYWEKNTVRISKLVDYIFNDLKIVGDRQEMNKGLNDKGFYIFEVKNSEKISTIKGELLVDRNLKRERIYNRGKDLKTTDDDEVWVTGSTKVEKNGKEVVNEITVPLYRKLTCQHFQSGVITTFANKVKVSELNYGTGDCDDQAVWTNYKVTKTITLKTWINYYSLKQ
jgi:hypothetical protein